MFAVFVGFVVLYLIGWVIAPDFPKSLIEQFATLSAFVLLIRAAFWKGELRLSYLGVAGFIALAGATASGGLAYRSPVGTYDWEGPVSPPDGRYALVGETDDTVFVVACDDRQAGVLAVPSVAVSRVTFSSIGLESPGPSLLQLILEPGSTLDFGALNGCDS